MENHSYSQIIGGAPYITGLARQCGLASNYAAISHPSLPNYIAATSGSTQGISDDDPPSAHPIAAASIFSQLTAARKSWRSYEESMPANCELSNAGEYAVKHNPAAYYTGIASQCASSDVPLGTPSSGPLASALKRNTLPAFSFVTPNLCNDMHDCSVTTGDGWLRSWLLTIMATNTYRSGKLVVFVTWDEGEGDSNQVATLVLSQWTRPGTRSARAFSHYSLLRTSEELLGLGRLGGAAAGASMRGTFHL